MTANRGRAAQATGGGLAVGAALISLVLSAGALLYGVLVQGEAGTVVRGAVAALQLALAASAGTVAIGATLSALRSAHPTRGLVLVVLALALDATWLLVIAVVAESA